MMKRDRDLHRTFSRATALCCLVMLGLPACAQKTDAPSQAQSDKSAKSEKMSFARSPAAGGAAASAPAALSADGAASAPQPPSAEQVANSSAAAIVTPTMVIRNGTATIEVDSLEIAIVAVQKLAASMGGYVGNTTQTTGSNMVRSAEIELKIPATKYDATVGNLGPIGKIEAQTSTAEDVGEEFFDVTARQANAHRLEERLIALLATRTGKLDDVLAVERELARVREEIERYEGRLRYLKSHVSTSTLMVTLHEKRAVVSGYEGTNVIVEAFKDAWRNFVQFIALLISSLGWLIPLGVVLVAGALAVRRLQRNEGDPTNRKKNKTDTPQ